MAALERNLNEGKNRIAYTLKEHVVGLSVNKHPCPACGLGSLVSQSLC